MKPLAIDLYCGLGGWAEGFLSEGWRVIGYDIEAHDYGTGGYPGELILRDVRSIHGSEFADADIIVGSSPCQEFSYRAMPWKRAKALPPPYLGIELFQAQFRIQREACEAAGRYIPLIVENVRGAQKWVGRARWHFGSYYLWGDVPALMPMTSAFKHPGTRRWNDYNDFGIVSPAWTTSSFKTVGHLNKRDGHTHTRHLTNQAEHFKGSGSGSGSGSVWFDSNLCVLPSQSTDRKAASALIAKIPFPLAQHIARVFKPEGIVEAANREEHRR